MTDFLMKVNSFYELKAADEENTYDVIVTDEMTPNDVVQKMMEIKTREDHLFLTKPFTKLLYLQNFTGKVLKIDVRLNLQTTINGGLKISNMMVLKQYTI